METILAWEIEQNRNENFCMHKNLPLKMSRSAGQVSASGSRNENLTLPNSGLKQNNAPNSGTYTVAVLDQL